MTQLLRGVASATGTHREYPFDVLGETAESPFEKGSSIRLDGIRTVSIEQRTHSVVESLDSETMDAVDDALELSLGLD